jgi:hypothetical protein
MFRVIASVQSVVARDIGPQFVIDGSNEQDQCDARPTHP